MPSQLPEQYQRYAPPGQPDVRHGEIELYADRDPVVYVPDAYGQMVPMRRSQLPTHVPPTPPRDLTPLPLLDPIAQRFIGAGVGLGVAGAGVGYGMGQMLAGLALGGTSGLAILVGLLLAAGMGGRRVVNVHHEQHTYVEQKWFGRNDIRNEQ